MIWTIDFDWFSTDFYLHLLLAHWLSRQQALWRGNPVGFLGLRMILVPGLWVQHLFLPPWKRLNKVWNLQDHFSSSRNGFLTCKIRWYIGCLSDIFGQTFSYYCTCYSCKNHNYVISQLFNSRIMVSVSASFNLHTRWTFETHGSSPTEFVWLSSSWFATIVLTHVAVALPSPSADCVQAKEVQRERWTFVSGLMTI